MNMEEFEIMTFEEWSKQFKSFIRAQLHSLSLETDSNEAKRLEKNIQYNTKMLEKANHLKDEALFYRSDYVLSYKIVGKEMKEEFERKEKRSLDVYA